MIQRVPKSDPVGKTSCEVEIDSEAPPGSMLSIRSNLVQVLTNLEVYDPTQIEALRKANTKLAVECQQVKDELKEVKAERLAYEIQMAAEYQDVGDQLSQLQAKLEKVERKAQLEVNLRRAAECKIASLEQEIEESRTKLEGDRSPEDQPESEDEPTGLERELLRVQRYFKDQEVKATAPEEKSTLMRKRQRVLHVENLEALFELIPPTDDVEFAYAWEREVFFLYTGLTFKEYISKSRFKSVWAKAVQIRSENLFTEIVGRGEVVVEDNAGAFCLIGDYGARILLFYSELEEKLAKRRQVAASYLGQQRVQIGEQLTRGVKEAIGVAASSSKSKGLVAPAEWMKTLTELSNAFKTQDWLFEMVRNVQNRAMRSQVLDVHPAAYVNKFGATKTRLGAKIVAGVPQGIPIWNFSADLAFKRPPLGETNSMPPGVLSRLITWKIPLPTMSSVWDDQFLGNYEQLFEADMDIPFPSWEALLWIGRDHIDVRAPPIVAMESMDHTERATRSQ